MNIATMKGMTVGEIPPGVRRWQGTADEPFLLRLEPDSDVLRTSLDAAAEWVATHKEAFDDLLLQYGGIRFRGFPIPDSAAFSTFLGAYPDFGTGYSGGTSPRSVIVGRVMEATAAPADRVVPIHQEMAYSSTFPARLAFYCEVAPNSGGETPACDMRKLTRIMPRRLHDKVRAQGLRYYRLFRSPDYATGIPELDVVHRTWQDTFNTQDPAEAERQVRVLGSDFEWLDSGLLVSNPSRGFVDHPDGGDEVWFNSIGGYGFSRDVLGDRMGELYEQHYFSTGRLLPYWTTYGDGEPLNLADVAPLYDATEEATVAIPWESGEVMLLDNIYAGHGRATFEGDRKVRVILLD